MISGEPSREPVVDLIAAEPGMATPRDLYEGVVLERDELAREVDRLRALLDEARDRSDTVMWLRWWRARISGYLHARKVGRRRDRTRRRPT